ncbi:MAG: type 4a pilus biogenesis protein PilO [Candidatus Moraniibacteriota bacterium]
MLFPISLIFAGISFWTLLWPQYSIFQDSKLQYQKNQEVLQGIQNRKVAIEKMNLQVAQNESENSAVLNYLTDKKMEEKIVKQLNYLASSSGVFLRDISLVGSSKGQIDSGAGAFPSSLVPALPVQNGVSANEIIQNIPVSISVQGDYDKLKNFFNAVQHLPILNSLKTLTITVDEKTSSDNTSNSTKTFTLEAKLTVDFGYLKKVKASAEKMASFDAKIDEKVINDLKAYISQDVPALTLDPVAIGAVGSNNPFLP